MINPELLAASAGNAVAILAYGGMGTRKTNAIHTLPPPILVFDMEQGIASLLPWLRRRKRWDETKWTEYTQAQREDYFARLNPEVLEYCKTQTRVLPAGYIDVVYFDPLVHDAYTELAAAIANFPCAEYNSGVIDSAQEFSQLTQSKVKGSGQELEPMVLRNWAGAQERAAIGFRKLKNYRDRGVFIYITCSEEIQKDYVDDPRSTPSGSTPPEPYSVKGTMSVPGQLANRVPHFLDIIVHARIINGAPTWVVKPEALPARGAHWESKDRFGRLPDYVAPNFRQIFGHIYGDDGRKTIYAAARSLLEPAN